MAGRVNHVPEEAVDWVAGLIVQLVNRRKELGLSQQDVADRLGYSNRGILGAWEIGRHTPRPATLVAWGRALGLELAWGETPSGG